MLLPSLISHLYILCKKQIEISCWFVFRFLFKELIGKKRGCIHHLEILGIQSGNIYKVGHEELLNSVIGRERAAKKKLAFAAKCFTSIQYVEYCVFTARIPPSISTHTRHSH